MKYIFTKKFNEVLSQSNKTQTKLAKEIGISKQCITDFKSGKSYPSIETLRLIAIALEVSTDYLLGLEDETGSKNYISNSFNNNNGNISFKG